LYSSTCGITTNISESMLKRAKNDAETISDFGRTVYVLYFFQVRYVCDITPGLNNLGELKLRNEQNITDVLEKICVPNDEDGADVVDRNIIKDIVYDGKYPQDIAALVTELPTLT